VAVIPLTFGNQSDWSKNVRAAGGCSIRVDGQDYAATEPEFVGRAGAGPLLRSAFSPMERASFRLLGIKQHLRLRVVPERTDELSRSRGARGLSGGRRTGRRCAGCAGHC
jgi:hypothetical protein